jgi:Cu/Ag efflux protein CusF
MKTRFAVSLLIALALVTAACGKKPEEKRYDMQGVVKALDPAHKTATIDAGKIGDWMEAMTMDYQVKPDSEFAKLRVGDKIQAKVVVTDASYYVTEVKAAP